MKDLQAFLNNIIDIFITKKSLPKDIFKDFVAYVYSTLENKIASSKQQSIKNKYIKIRHSVLQYIIANEKSIMLSIRNKNKK